MTTTDPTGGAARSGLNQPPRRMLRRSRTDRVGAGVAGGLGEYFGLDPVLFRVLFATASFFGGAGVLGYLLAWAAIPDAGTEHAPIDRWIKELRRRRVPFWLVAVAGALVLWAVAFSWWAPGPTFPVAAVVIVLVAVFGRRGRDVGPAGRGGQSAAAAPADGAGVDSELDSAAATTVSLEKAEATASAPAAPPTWVSDVRQWAKESRAASRRRRRRAAPVKIAAIVTLTLTLTVLGLIDAAHGIPLPVYFWVALGIVGLALLTGVVLRRTPWSLAWLLIPVLIGVNAFGDTHASLHDGFGQKQWRPVAVTDSAHYRLAFGQGILDLRALPPLTAPETIDVTMASGQVQVIVPATLNVSVRAEIHIGELTVDGSEFDDGGWGSGGVNVDRTVQPGPSAVGAPLLVRVHLADGNVAVNHK